MKLKLKLSLSTLALSFLINANCSILNTNNIAHSEVFNDKKNEKIDELLNQLQINDKFMGSISIRKNNEIIYNSAHGFRYISDSKKLASTTLTKYRVGSISKMFTSVMILQLIEEKKITLDTKLSEFFPEIKNSKIITIDNLLHHRSGIVNLTAHESYFLYYTKYNSPDEMVKIITNLGSDFEPNKKFQYSNSNYILLGYIIENITGKDYKTNLKNRIVEKINLKNTYYGDNTNLANNESYSYAMDNKKFLQQPETNMSVPHGAGGVVSNANDLTIFINALFDKKLINETSLNEMIKLQDGYGKGIMAIPFYNKSGFGNGGSIDAFQSMLIYFPQDKTSFAVTSNYLNYSMNDILIKTLSIYYDKDYKSPVFTKTTAFKVKDEILKGYEGVYSSKDFPLKISIKVIDKKVIAQATGQSSIELTPISENEFVFEDADIKINFIKDKGTFVFTQKGVTLNFKRD